MQYRIVAFSIALLLIAGCQNEQETIATTSSLPSYKLEDLHVGAVKRSEVPDLYQATGVVIASRLINVMASEKGAITQLLVDEGDEVKAGDLLAVIDSVSADLEIESAQSAIHQSRIRLEDKIKLKEMATSLRGTEGSFSEERYRKSKVEEDLARTSLEQATIQLKQAEARQPYHKLYAPENGIIVSRSVERGEVVMVGTVLIQLEQKGWKEFEALMPARWLTRIQKGDHYQVMLHGEEKEVDAVVTHVIPSVDRRTQMGKVKLRIDDQKVEILSGQSGQVGFVIGRRDQLLVPHNALIEKAGVQGVYRVDGSSRVRFTPVKTERVWGQQWVVQSGLHEGERIIIGPPNELRDGVAVTG